MDAKKLEPLREMAKKWHKVAFAGNSDYHCGIEHGLEQCADELDAFCDAAEAWLKEQYPYATKTRRVLLGEKK